VNGCPVPFDFRESDVYSSYTYEEALQKYVVRRERELEGVDLYN
jgi:hypothetical protein